MKNIKLFWIFGSILIIGLFLISKSANKHPEKIFWSDMEGYYVYLPATFIYGGFKTGAARDTNYLRPLPGKDIIYTKYTSGVAFLEAPFFALAHIFSKPFGFPADGHSLLYSYSIMLAAIFYMLAGMFLLWKVCRRYYSQKASLTVLACLFMGTNLYYYTLFQPGMSHVFSFFLFSSIIFLTERIIVEKETKWSTFLIFGLACGLIVLTRPTAIIILIYPLYRWLKNTENKTKWLKENWGGGNFSLSGHGNLDTSVYVLEYGFW